MRGGGRTMRGGSSGEGRTMIHSTFLLPPPRAREGVGGCVCGGGGGR